MIRSKYLRWTIALLTSILSVVCMPCVAQEDAPAPTSAETQMTSQQADLQHADKGPNQDSGIRTIIVEAGGPQPEPPLFFTAHAIATVQVGSQSIEQVIVLSVKVIQGKAKTVSLGLGGAGEVTEVSGPNLRSWSVRRQGELRFLDLQLNEDAVNLEAEIKVRSDNLRLPVELDVAHLAPGESVGFDSIVNISYGADVAGTVIAAEGFAPLEASDRTSRFQTASGGKLKLSLKRAGTAPASVEWLDMTLDGTVHDEGNSIHFQLRGSARVSEPNAEVTILSGNAAVQQIPEDPNYRLRLVTSGDSAVYKLVFSDKGTFPVALDFVAKLTPSDDSWQAIDFTVATSAVVPLKLRGLDTEIEFYRDRESVVPLRDNETWLGFLPATGRAKLQWKAARQAGEGKLFFTTTGQIEATVDAGLLRQDHLIQYRVLQGELQSFNILLSGPGEILDVQGNNIVSWKVVDQGDERQLEAVLSQPLTGESQIKVRSQTTLGAFPVRVDGLRLSPIGAIRHSGFLRLTNLGSVRLEPTGLRGLTQLSPDQFPGSPIEARQVFVYRFPAADHAFTVAADRIQSEVNVSELVLYELTESDRVMKADVELDIREAPIREWDFVIPADYSVVSVTGASVADTMVGSEVIDGGRNLKVVFSQDVEGRQLVILQLEKSETAADGDWLLPRITYPTAKTVRGDIGVIGAPGFRITVGETDLLVEKPLSYFPKPSPNLQQAFRIREPGWSATMLIERLERSVQADVFHLVSLSEETVYGSALINYFVTGSPVSEWKITVPQDLGNVMVDGQDVRTWRREGDTLIVVLHQPVMGAYTLLVTFEEKPDNGSNSFQPGQIAPNGVQSERGTIQVVSPVQVEINTVSISPELLKLDPLELPAELRLLSTAPPLGTWQYTARPFDLNLNVRWFQPGAMVAQVVEFAEASSRVSLDGELVTDVIYFVKSRGQRTLKIKLPAEPVRLWSVSVNGKPVTARQADEATLIPLPGGIDPNIPVEVSLRFGKPAVDESNPELTLPIVLAPVLKTQWNVSGDEERILVPNGGTVKPPVPVLRPVGFHWIARQGIVPLLLIGLLTGLGTWACRRTQLLAAMGMICLGLATAMSLYAATLVYSQTEAIVPLQLSLPILSAGEAVVLKVDNLPLWRANISWTGLIVCISGIALAAASFVRMDTRLRMIVRCAGVLLIGLGILLQHDGTPLFFVILALFVLLLLVRLAVDAIRRAAHRIDSRTELTGEKNTTDEGWSGGGLGPVTTSLIMLAVVLASSGTGWAEFPGGYEAADSITQEWQVSRQDARLTASGTIQLTGYPGDQFLFLRAPAVLTRFEGEGLRLTKQEVPGEGLAYVISIPAKSELPESQDETPPMAVSMASYTASFEFQLEAITPSEGIPVLTGTAAVQEINLSYDEAGWDVVSPHAVRIEAVEGESSSQAKVLLGPGRATLFLKPQARDVTTEERQFFVEAANLYLLGPGVVDGVHRLHLRTSRGQVRELNVMVPPGLTVSAVSGPIGSWQFDADSGRLKVEVELTAARTFDVMIETQRGLDPLPAEVTLAPLKVADANGEIGLLAVAFGPEAQPEKIEPQQMSAVNLGDFDPSLMANRQAVLHRIYRYGAEGGELAVQVTAVDSDVRVASQQVLSLGDERLVLNVNFTAEISRSGLFQLSFPLPAGLEVESLSGNSLHHWAELVEGDSRQIILHLNGKTIGTQSFTLTLTGVSPSASDDWQIPRFELNEAARQTGDLVVRPTTGLRLRTVSRQNISESDPRSLGGESQGALAFRLLQRDWNLVLGIEQLEPWITGQMLHEVTLREGQTLSALLASFQVQNASIRALQVVLPISNEDEIKTLRATGDTVSDFVRTAPDSNIWEVQFKRRVVGKVDFRIEYERRGNSVNEIETVRPAEFPQSRQIAYYLGIRASGRLELEIDNLSNVWQRVDWGSIPATLRESANRAAPAFTLRAVGLANPLVVRAKRHSLADALKLRVAQGVLTTVLSPGGSQLTSVDLTIEVIQLSSLSVNLPENGELFSIFVNGESVNSIRLGGNNNTWQFTILPGIDDRTAQVRLVYSVNGESLSSLKLVSPELNVPLENIQWQVIAPKGFELLDSDGNLELVQQANQETYDRDAYLSKVSGKRQVQAQQATELLEQANQLLQAGEQTKARWALNSVANQYALDAASNEDARVQLENLQTQQAIVGLNTRRQRLYLDNSRSDTYSSDNLQLREAAADNPILQQDQTNFRPQQLSELLRGNTTEDNAILSQIAARLVQHQRTTEPAPQAILISLPEEGTVYTFSRSVQVVENQPLELDLDIRSQYSFRPWQVAVVSVLLIALAVSLSLAPSRFNSNSLPT